MVSTTRLRSDPVVAVAVLSLWLLLALFVVYPLAMLLARVLFDHGAFTLSGLAAVLTDLMASLSARGGKSQVRAVPSANFTRSVLSSTLVVSRVVERLIRFPAGASDRGGVCSIEDAAA